MYIPDLTERYPEGFRCVEEEDCRLVCFMYQEGKNYYVTYGNADDLWGPDEKCFGNKADAEKFVKDYKERWGLE